MSRKGGAGEVGGFYYSAKITWLLLGLALKSPWLEAGWPFSPHLDEWAKKKTQSSRLIGPSFLAVKFLPCLDGRWSAESCDYRMPLVGGCG